MFIPFFMLLLNRKEELKIRQKYETCLYTVRKKKRLGYICTWLNSSFIRLIINL